MPRTITVESRVLDRRALSMAEAGEAYGISKITVWRLVRAGELLSFKVGRRRLVTVDSLEARFRPTPVVTQPKKIAANDAARAA